MVFLEWCGDLDLVPVAMEPTFTDEAQNEYPVTGSWQGSPIVTKQTLVYTQATPKYLDGLKLTTINVNSGVTVKLLTADRSQTFTASVSLNTHLVLDPVYFIIT